MSSVPKGKLSIGTVYETKQGERGIFLGYIQTEDLNLKWPNGKSTWANRSYRSYGAGYGNGQKIEKPTLVSRPFKKYLLWYKISTYSYVKEKIDPSLKLLTESLAKTELDYNFAINGSHSMVKEVTKIPVPEDVIEQVRLKAIEGFKSRLAHYLNQPTKTSNTYGHQTYDYDIEETICNASAMCLMRVPGQPEPNVGVPHFSNLRSKVGQIV
jgi:hypothetical protein